MCFGFFLREKVSRDWLHVPLGLPAEQIDGTRKWHRQRAHAVVGHSQEGHKRKEERRGREGSRCCKFEEVNWLRWGVTLAYWWLWERERGGGRSRKEWEEGKGGGGEARWGMITPRQKGRTIETGNRVSVYPRAGRIFQNKTLEVDRLCLSMYASFYQMCQSYIRASMCRNA